ncbi:hypothetical protein [Argonema galeatum]|uniref:hypothetical protein n=1 Tax=Argonema galeatum TaxID=2942762 RepID=UPI00201144E4|nr:hypothetical protein [Argonema galeatum]MCL1467558.1 hypothetical protein [Argonema galeatum A003/A1]
MANPKRAAELIRKHFAEITTEQFIENLNKHCPEVFEDDVADAEISQSEINQSKDELEKKAARA